MSPVGIAQIWHGCQMREDLGEIVALGRPHARSRRLSVLLFFAYASLVAVFQGVANILLPATVERIAPASKLSTLAVLSTVSAIATVCALLAGGAVSDRTFSRWGRRTPSLAVSCVTSIVLMLAVGTAVSTVSLMVLMPLLWFSCNYYQGVLLAILPDRIPEQEQGFASSAIGVGVPVGLFVGVNLAAWAPNPMLGYALLTIPLAVSTAALFFVEPERASMYHDHREATSDAGVITPYFSAFADRDFSLAFAARFLLFLAYYTISGYLFYIVQDYVGVSHLPSRNAGMAVSSVMSLLTVGWLVITPLTALISDRAGDTAKIVAWTSVAIGAVMLVPAFSNSWTAMLAFGAGLGLTFGVYFAIDIKLSAMVLASKQDAGRDMGFLVLAGSGPTVLAPAIAAGIITQASFPALFIFGGLTALAGGVAAYFIQTRR